MQYIKHTDCFYNDILIITRYYNGGQRPSIHILYQHPELVSIIH